MSGMELRREMREIERIDKRERELWRLREVFGVGFIEMARNRGEERTRK